jgi:hypothetical protein
MSDETPLDPYAPPRTDVGGAATLEPAEALTPEEIRAFVGPRAAGYYGRRWSRALATGRLPGFNWAAMVCNFLWLLYRRMYKELAIALGATMALAAVVELLPGTVAAQLSPALDFAPGVVIGVLGNWLYLRRARRAVAAARALPSPDQRFTELVRRGGVSWLAVGIGLAVTAAGGVVLGYLASSFSALPNQ